MDKYIAQEAAKKAACEGCNAEFGEDPCEPCDCSLMVAIDAIQAADVVERKSGKWKTALLEHEGFGIRPMVLYCSECQQVIAYPTQYCPNCGARMVEDDV